MFRVEISDDRAPERRRADPVAAGAGVFAPPPPGAPPVALGPAERDRPARAEAAAARRARDARPLWSPAGILKRLTDLYARFGRSMRREGER